MELAIAPRIRPKLVALGLSADRLVPGAQQAPGRRDRVDRTNEARMTTRMLRNPASIWPALALALLITAATALSPTRVAAAGESATAGPTAAECKLNWRTTGGGYWLTGWHPTGTTAGYTDMAAMVQGRDIHGQVHNLGTWRVIAPGGGLWLRTTRSQFPYGQFSNGEGWYRATTILTNPYSGIYQYRIYWHIEFNDYTTTSRTTQWVICG
jgi:hypothetical protein